MNQTQLLPCAPVHEAEQTQTIYVDGCKGTIRYTEKENPDAIRGIKEILLSNIAKRT